MLYVPLLEAAGFEVEVRSMFSDMYLARLYESGRKNVIEVAHGYFRRVGDLLRARDFHAVWLEKELFPFWPAVFERLLAAVGTPYVVDYDDAIFHTYDGHGSSLVRGMFRDKLRPLIRGAFAVTVGNRYLADWARMSGARKVEIVPTVIDYRRYPPPLATRDTGDELRIGWIGTPVTTQYLWLVRDALRHLAKRHPLRLITIGAAPLVGYGVPVEQHTWTVETEAARIMQFDVGIMPLRDSPWERGKCGYKLVQYLGCGKPVVASPVGVNVDIVSGADVGFLASNTNEWTAALETLSTNLKLRGRMGENGRRLVESTFSVEAVGSRIVALMDQACIQLH